MAMSTGEVYSMFPSLQENLKLIQAQLDDEDAERKNEEINIQEFWQKLIPAAKAVSLECTKLCLAFSQPPLMDSDSCQALIQKVEATSIVLLSAFYGLPKSQGKTLHRKVKQAIQNIFSSIQVLITDIQEYKFLDETKKLKSTGTLWEVCENVEKLPRDNLSAVLHGLKTENFLIQDAVEELDEAIKNDNSDDENSWSETDHLLLPTCLGLIKTAKSCFKKVIQALTALDGPSIKTPTELDTILEVGSSISSYVDDFVTCLYPPLRKLAANEAANILAVQLRSFLMALRSASLCTEKDHSWLQFLLNAVDHNLNKVQALTDQNRTGQTHHCDELVVD